MHRLESLSIVFCIRARHTCQPDWQRSSTINLRTCPTTIDESFGYLATSEGVELRSGGHECSWCFATSLSKVKIILPLATTVHWLTY